MSPSMGVGVQVLQSFVLVGRRSVKGEYKNGNRVKACYGVPTFGQNCGTNLMRRKEK